MCYSNKDRSEDPVNLIGMKVWFPLAETVLVRAALYNCRVCMCVCPARQLLLRLLQNLLLHPADLDEHLAAVVDVCFFHLLSQVNVDNSAMVCARSIVIHSQ